MMCCIGSYMFPVEVTFCRYVCISLCNSSYIHCRILERQTGRLWTSEMDLWWVMADGIFLLKLSPSFYLHLSLCVLQQNHFRFPMPPWTMSWCIRARRHMRGHDCHWVSAHKETPVVYVWSNFWRSVVFYLPAYSFPSVSLLPSHFCLPLSCVPWLKATFNSDMNTQKCVHAAW